MKKVFVFLLVIISAHCSGQEELFGDQNGLSYTCMQSYVDGEIPNTAFSLSVLVKKHVSISAGMLHIDHTTHPIFGLTFLSKPNKGKNTIRLFLGFTYLKIFDNQFGGVSFGLFKRFFPESKFPLALTSGFAGQVPIQKDQFSDVNISPTFGLHYTQGLFARNSIYPIIGFGSTYIIESNSLSYSAMLGINIKIKPKENKADILN